MDAVFPGTLWRPGLPPGLYEVRPAAAERAEVRMDVAAFVGLAERGPPFEPVVIESWEAFRLHFGEPGGGHLLPQCVYLFFLNGGRRCVVVRALDAATSQTAVWALSGLIGRATRQAPSAAARDPGIWGNRIRTRLRFRIRELPLEPTRDGKGLVERGPLSSLVPGALLRLIVGMGEPAYRFVTAVRSDAGEHRFLLNAAVPTGPRPGLVQELTLDLDLGIGTLEEGYPDSGLHPDHPAFVLARLEAESRILRPLDTTLAEAFIPAPGVLEAGAIRILGAADRRETAADAALGARREHFFGAPLDALQEYDEHNVAQPVSLVHLPDLAHARPREEREAFVDAAPPGGDPTRFETCARPTPERYGAPVESHPGLGIEGPGDYRDIQAWQQALVRWCEQGDRIAVLDLPPGLDSEQVRRWRLATASNRAALYAPYLRIAPVENPQAPLLTVPPGASVCGLIARRERALGVQAAPANETLAGVAQLDPRPLPDPGLLHELGVNLIRETAAGFALLAARTTSLEPLWQQVSVRRLLDYLKRQLALDARWAVFEPNDPLLCGRLNATVERRLRVLFEGGAFRGTSPEQAWFVRCERQGDAARVLVSVGVAPALPAEFILFQLSLLDDASVRIQEIGDAGV